MDTIVSSILVKLDLNPLDYGVKPYGTRLGCTNYNLVKAYLINKSTEKTAEYLGYSYICLERYMQRYWFTKYPYKGKSHWYSFFLKLILLKECSACFSYLTFDSYHTNNSTLSRLSGKCKKCMSLYAKKTYLKFRGKRLINMIAYYRANKSYFKAKSSKYRATRVLAQPSWADSFKIRQFYKDCPDGYHVDHIIPLKGKLVCGFHILENLQYLTAAANLTKSNTYVIQ